MSITINMSKTDNYDSLFLCAEEFLNNNTIKISKFYINKREYIHFANSLEQNESALSFNYKHSQQTITINDLRGFLNNLNFRFDVEIEKDVDSINNVLKTISIVKKSNGNYELDDELQRYKSISNEYFENKIIELKKSSNTFPFKGSENDVKLYRTKRLVMFNIGQGNLSALFTNYYPSYIFDLGYGYKNDFATIMLNHLNLSSDKLTTIVISHYHNDHINYASELPNRGANLEFIMPDFLNKSDIYKPNIQILINKIIHNGNRACFILNNTLVNPINYGPLSLYQGNMNITDRNQHSKENSHGIITVINTITDKVLLLGDALYNDMFTTIIEKIKPTYMIIPDHGCSINHYGGFPNYLDLSLLKESFVFAKCHRGYKHPNLTHLRLFMDKPIIRLSNKNEPHYIYDKNKRILDKYCKVLNYPIYIWNLD